MNDSLNELRYNESLEIIKNADPNKWADGVGENSNHNDGVVQLSYAGLLLLKIESDGFEIEGLGWNWLDDFDSFSFLGYKLTSLGQAFQLDLSRGCRATKILDYLSRRDEPRHTNPLKRNDTQTVLPDIPPDISKKNQKYFACLSHTDPEVRNAAYWLNQRCDESKIDVVCDLLKCCKEEGRAFLDKMRKYEKRACPPDI